MSPAAQAIVTATDNGITLAVIDGSLTIEADSEPPSWAIAKIREHAAEIVFLLSLPERVAPPAQAGCLLMLPTGDGAYRQCCEPTVGVGIYCRGHS